MQRGVLIAAVLGTIVSAGAFAEEGPRLKAPTFPLEPGKKPTTKINPDSYVEGPSSPPPTEADLPVRSTGRDPDVWWNDLQVGWAYDNLNADHAFSNGLSVKRANSNPLGLHTELEMRPPRSFVVPLSGIVAADLSVGRAEAETAGNVIAPTRFDCQDFRALAGARLHLLPRSWRGDLRFGGDISGIFSSHATLVSTLDQIDVDFRTVLSFVPRVEFQFAGTPNWAIEAGLGYGLPLSTSGAGDTTASRYRRVDTDLHAIRYIAPGHALGLGAFYSVETADWTRTVPSALTDHEVAQDLRLNLFWRKEL